MSASPGSRASASVVYKIIENGGASRVELSADIKLSGALAQMGRTGIVQDVATQITEQFAASLRATLAAEAAEAAASEAEPGGAAAPTPPPPPPPAVPAEIRGEALMLKIIWRRIKALFGFAG